MRLWWMLHISACEAGSYRATCSNSARRCSNPNPLEGQVRRLLLWLHGQ